MFSWTTQPLLAHLILLIVAALAPVWAAGARGSVLLSLLLAATLGIDANLAEMPTPFRVFPWFLFGVGAFVLAAESTRMRSLLATLGERVRGRWIYHICFTATLLAFLLQVVVGPALVQEPPPLESDVVWDLFDEFHSIASSPLRTDHGRPIPAQVHKSPSTSPQISFREAEGKHLFALGMNQHVIALEQSWMPCNCHGYVFTAGRYFIDNDDVATILRDNDYTRVTLPRLGDLVVYRDRKDCVVHTGIVRGRRGAMVLVESKFGRLGCFLHPLDIDCYRFATAEFYRSPRGGHLLRGVEETPMTFAQRAQRPQGSELKSFSE
jgi:hypothetical protein